MQNPHPKKPPPHPRTRKAIISPPFHYCFTFNTCCLWIVFATGYSLHCLDILQKAAFWCQKGRKCYNLFLLPIVFGVAFKECIFLKRVMASICTTNSILSFLMKIYEWLKLDCANIKSEQLFFYVPCFPYPDGFLYNV